MPLYLTPVPNPGDIIGRQDILDLLHKTLKKGNPVALIHGIGGIGKTTIAYAYAYHPNYVSDYDVVLHVEVVTAFPDAFLYCDALLQFLEVVESVQNKLLGNADALNAFKLIANALRRSGQKLLLIIDNANTESEISRFVPHLTAPHISIVLTSRAIPEDIERIQVSELSSEELSQLFCRHYFQDNNKVRADGDLKRLPVLTDLLWRHTLLVEMIAKAGRKAGYSIEDLILYVKNLGIKHPDLQIKVGTGQSGQTHRMYKSTIPAFVGHIFRDLLQLEEEEIAFLKCIAVLPSRAYPIEDIAEIFEIPEAELGEMQSVMIEFNDIGIPLLEDHKIRLHPVFRFAVTELLAPFTPDDFYPITSFLQIKLARGQNLTLSSISEQNRILEIAESLFGFLSSECIDPDLIVLINQAGLLLEDLGKRDKAIEYFQTGLDVGRKVFSTNDDAIATIQTNLALALHNSGKHEDAIELLRQALETDITIEGEYSNTVAGTRENLAAVLLFIPQLRPEAIQQFKTALDIKEKNMGGNHPETTKLRWILNALETNNARIDFLAPAYNSESDLEGINILIKLGQIREATTLVKKEIQKIKNRHGVYHKELIGLYTAHAGLLTLLNRPHEALLVVEEALQVAQANNLSKREEILIKASVIDSLKAIGNRDAAIEMLNAWIKIFESEYAWDDDNLAKIKNSLGHAYLDAGDYESAQNMFQECLEHMTRASAYSDPLVGVIKSNLGQVFYKKGEQEAAITLLLQAIDNHEYNYGKDYILISTHKNRLARIYLEQNKYLECRQYIREALEIAIKNYGEYHPSAISDLIVLAVSSYKGFSKDEGVLNMKRAYALTLGSNNPQLVRQHQVIKSWLASWGEKMEY